MFSFASGKTSHPNVFTVVEVKRSPKQDTFSKSSRGSSRGATSPVDSLQPAIDGPPSPERIRAYTEQMKRNSTFGTNSRSNTASSATSSFLSRDSDTASLSRKSSNASSMPSTRGERPDSFGKSIFSRVGRKVRREGNSLANSTSSLTSGDNGSEEILSAREQSDLNKKNSISDPYNFQHVTHTRPDHVSRLGRASKNELVTEFSALRAAQAPTSGELKGIRAQDLHFRNFSSEALSALAVEDMSPETSPSRERGVLRQSISPPQRYVNQAMSMGDLRSPPPRPPRSPLSPICPITLPTRTSSRTASVLLDSFDPLASTTLQRPLPANGGFRRPTPLGLPPRLPPPPPSWSEQQEGHFESQSNSDVLIIPDSWPLPAPAGAFGELADVQEEDEDHHASRRPSASKTSAELRASQSVPLLRTISQDQSADRPTTTSSSTLGRSPSSGTMTIRKSSSTTGLNLNDDWENAVDYAYEHEVEADCDYEWDRWSVEKPVVTELSQNFVEQPTFDLHLGNDDRSAYKGPFRPSLLVPTPYELPELSPISNTSTSASDPRTPSNFLQPISARPLSQVSCFKESHGFTLSPSLLIPRDFQSQIDQDYMYDDNVENHATSASMFSEEPYNHSFSSVDEAASSTASYRSSNFSRISARSSSSTRISSAHSRASQDSSLIHSRNASTSQAHRSADSSSSLPDLIPSSFRRSQQLAGFDIAASPAPSSKDIGDVSQASQESETVSSSSETSVPHRRNKSVGADLMIRKGANHFAPPASSYEVERHPILSPVAETFVESPRDKNGSEIAPQAHERKISAPVSSLSVKEFKGRARAATCAGQGGKKVRGGYGLFPQI